jgi:hypothetical protein
VCLVSRTCTAPFDRLKIFLITRPPDLGGALITPKPSIGGAKVIASAVARIYAEGGVLAFWTGNGLSVPPSSAYFLSLSSHVETQVAKIFPESAIKFFAYESSVCLPVHIHVVTSDFLPETSLCKILGQGGRPAGYQRCQPISIRWYRGYQQPTE